MRPLDPVVQRRIEATAMLTAAVSAYGLMGFSWGAHIAFDRALGWGLEYEQSFCHTDMGLKELPFPNRVLGPNPEGAR